MIVKVQIAVAGDYMALVYNKDRSFNVECYPQELPKHVFDECNKNAERYGGPKAFFDYDQHTNTFTPTKETF